MTNRQMGRSSGIAVLMGAVVFAVHIVLRSVIAAGGEPVEYASGVPWLTVNAVGGAGRGAGAAGAAGAVWADGGCGGEDWAGGDRRPALAWLFFGWVPSLYALLVQPWLADQAPALVAADAALPVGPPVNVVLALLAWLIGAVLLAVPFVRGHVRPRWVGYLRILAGVWMAVGNLVIAKRAGEQPAHRTCCRIWGRYCLMWARGIWGTRCGWRVERRGEGVAAAV